MSVRNTSSWLAQPPPETAGRSIAERFGVPHDFPPQLSLPQALIRVVAVMVRVLLGSFWFAVCGVWAIRAWNAIPNPFGRGAAMAALALLFLLPLAALLIGVSAAVKAISPERR